MKKIFLALLLILFLTACSNSRQDEVEQTLSDEFPVSVIDEELIDNTQIDLLPIDITSNVNDSNEPNYIEVSITIDKGDGIVSNYNFSHIELYSTFDEMVNSELGEFKYLLLESVSDFSDYSNMYTFTDVSTMEEVKVVFYKNTYDFMIGEKYIMHVFTEPEYDYYFVSDVQHGIFQMKGNRVQCSNKFSNIFNKSVNSEEEFLHLFKKSK